MSAARNGRVVLVLLCFCFHFICSNGYNLAIIHTNDIHSHVEEMNKYSGECKEKDKNEGKCFGGIARRVTKINELKGQSPNHILLDAGDQFQGTLWFTIYRGMTSAKFMNQLQYDAMSFGNHEFDHGVAGLVPFINNLTFPVVNCNMDVTKEPRLQKKFHKHIVLTIGGEKIGVVGYLIPETKSISNPDPTVVFKDVISSVQTEVNHLQQKNVNKIIGLGHYGYGNDMKLAAAVDGLDVIVGGHTHSFLYSGTQPSNDDPEGPYPTIVTKEDGDKTLVVQSFWSGKYLGFLNVTFDDNGVVTSWEGQPILLNNSIAKDNETEEEVERLKKPLEKEKRTNVGLSAVFLEGTQTVCRLQECNIGNLITDAMVSYHADTKHEGMWSSASIAILNSGGIRSAIEKGNITRGDILTLMPFGNTVDIIEIYGKYLRRALEHAVAHYNTTDRTGSFLQMSGIKVTYDFCKPVGQRVISVETRCQNCIVPVYSPLDDNFLYRVITLDFLIKGGDGFTVLANHEKWEKINDLDSDVLVSHLKRHSPIVTGVEGRITLLHKPCLKADVKCQREYVPCSIVNSASPHVSSLTVVVFSTILLLWLS